MTNIAIENGPVEIVDFPINSMVIFLLNMGIFPLKIVDLCWARWKFLVIFPPGQTSERPRLSIQLVLLLHASIPSIFGPPFLGSLDLMKNDDFGPTQLWPFTSYKYLYPHL